MDVGLILISWQIITSNQYSTFFLMLIMSISYGLSIVNLSVVSKMFFHWLKRERSMLILVYGMGTAFLVCNAIISIVLFDGILLEKPASILSGGEVLFPAFEKGTFMATVFSFQSYTNIGYFILMWLGTIILLHYKRSKIGNVKFYVFSLMPLIYFMSYYFTIFPIINPEQPDVPPEELMGLILFFGYATMGGGIIIAIGFREISKLVLSNRIRNSLLLTSMGFIIYFVCGSASIGQAPYPPFGIVSISFLGIGSLLVLNGLYISAMHLSVDKNLRQIVRSAIDATRLLDKIGSAQFNIEMEKVTLRIIQENKNLPIPEFNEIDSNAEIKNYIKDILAEMQEVKNSQRSD